MIEFTLDELTLIQKALHNAENDLTWSAFGDNDTANTLGSLADRVEQYVSLERDLAVPTQSAGCTCHECTPADVEEFWSTIDSVDASWINVGDTKFEDALPEPRIYDVDGNDITNSLSDEAYNEYADRLPASMREAYYEARYGVPA